jgi:predicted nucleic acid-binding protein
MEIAIFDTSVWINLDKNVKNDETFLVEEYVQYFPDKLYLTPTIIQEILHGSRTIAEFEYKKRVLNDFNIFNDNWVDTSIAAAKLYFDLRKKGVTIRKSTDCLIAQIAIQNNVLLVHNDTDFDQIAMNSELRTFKK